MTKARGAGRPRAVLAKANRRETAQARRALGTLASLKVGPRIAKRYQLALQVLFSWMRAESLVLPQSADDFDMVICQFIEACWQEGDGRSRAADVVCALQWTSPLLKRQLNGSWALLKAWQRTELPARAPPMPPKVVFALAEWLLRKGWTGMAVGIVVAAHCFLRTGELLGLAFGQLAWADDCRSAIVSLGITKGGARRGAAESVQIELAWLSLALRAWALTEPGPLVVNMSQHKFRELFAQGLEALGCAGWGFAPYSLRRGGATELWRRTGALGRVTLRGRWAQPATARIYINDGLAVLAEMRLPQEPVGGLAHAFCNRFSCASQLFEVDLRP